MGTLLQDLRYGARMLLKSPGFTFVVILTLALAIGANSVIFSFVNLLVLRPLPIRDAKRVGFIWGVDPQRGDDRAGISPADFLDLRERSTRFQELAADQTAVFTLTGEGDPLRVSASRATPSFFSVWGLDAVEGRTFDASEGLPGAPGVVMLSHGFWERQFAADPGIIGTALTLDGQPYNVIGVLTPEFEVGNLSLIDVWTPLKLSSFDAERTVRDLTVCGRLVPGATMEGAHAEISAIAKQLQVEHPETNAGWEARVLGARDSLVGPNIWLILALLGIVVTGVLLVGCSNVANLVMARAVGRRRELAIRAAMGAKRSGVVRQLLIESLMLSLLGGAGGLLLAEVGFRVIRAAAYEPFFELVKVDRQVLVFAAALSLVTPLVFSLIPALQASRAELADLLSATGGRGSAGPRGRRGRNVFVVSQLAIACSLMILAMLVVRTVDAVNRIDWGFDSSQLLTLRFELPREKYQEDRQLVGFLDGLLPRLRGLAGVQQAAVVSPLPIFGEERTIRLTIEDWVVEEEKDRPWAVCVRASDHYLETLGLPLLKGRGLSRQETPQSKRVALINQELARRYWPDIDPVGRHFAIENEMLGEIGEWVEVVGVTGDIRSRDLTDAPSPTVFLPFSQSPARSAAVVLRSTTNPTDLVPAIRHEFREADPDLAIYDVKTMTEAYDEDNASTEILSGLFSAFAVIALLMSVAGLYAMVSYTVSQRKHEISIRMALGARGADIRSMVLGEGAKLTGLSIGLGLLGGWALGRLIASELYGVTPTDPMTYAVVALILAAVALAGSFVPAYRATRVDPIQTLRSE